MMIHELTYSKYKFSTILYNISYSILQTWADGQKVPSLKFYLFITERQFEHKGKK